MAMAVLAFVSCQKKETEIKSEETVIAAADSTDTIIDTVNTVTDEVPAATPAPDTKDPEKKVVEVVNPDIKIDYASFGAKIGADKAINNEQMLRKYKAMKPGDTVAVKFKSKIKGVCQKKGCWMSLEMPGGKESFVKFKDYAFFVPLNAAEQEAIVSGKAFVSETSVAQLRHYAKDAGKSEQEIAKITEPEMEYKFMADGVLISK